MSIWNFILDELIHGSRVVLLLNVLSEGSSPGKAGFKMAVSSSGKKAGTIGGGIMEFNLVQKSVELLGKDNAGITLQTLVHNTRDPESSGLICAGRQLTALIPLSRDAVHTIRAITDAEKKHRSGILKVNNTELTFDSDAVTISGKPMLFSGNASAEWSYTELLNRVPVVFIFGAGHVGTAVYRAISFLGYPIVLFDERPDYPQRNSLLPQEVAGSVLHTYAEVKALFGPGYFPAALICTNAFPADIRALETILPYEWKFIGLMGSNAKIHRIMTDLSNAGFTSSQLERIITPFGLVQHTHTPEEIAISVAAQLLEQFRQFENTL